MFDPPAWQASWLSLALLMAAAALEEVIFRGGLQAWLSGRAWAQQRYLGVSLANLITSLVFGLAHGLLRSWLLLPVTIAVGLGLGALFEARKSLVLCVIVHAGLNGLWWLIRPFGVGVWW
jgi:uncharacterized protein